MKKLNLIIISSIIFFLFAGCQKQVEIPSINFEAETINLNSGQQENLKIYIDNSIASPNLFNWYSNNYLVARVNSEGVVSAYLEGSANIIAIHKETGLEITCQILVRENPVTGISLNYSQIEIVNKDNFMLFPIIEPFNAKNKKVNWYSDNEDIVIISNNGLVSAINVGEANISVISEDGEYIAYCKVKVLPINVESININEYEEVSLSINNEMQLTYSIYPSNATNKNVTWNSEDENIVEVSTNGILKAKSVGSTIINVISEDGLFEDSIIVNTFYREMISYYFSDNNKVIYVGEEYQTSLTFMPFDTSDRDVIYQSSNEDIAIIDNNGKISAISSGNVIIKAIHISTNLEATFILNVLEN